MYMQKNPLEIEALFKDLVIGVTSFFRDPEAYQVLEEKVLPNCCTAKTRTTFFAAGWWVVRRGRKPIRWR
jgi:chemotaxis methyl-accepting protein methylase